MKKLYIICLFLLCGLAAMAQEFEVVSVEHLPLDGTAINEKMTEPVENGRLCAVIRIATLNISPEQRKAFDFGFDWGSYQAQRADRSGEIWLWVSPELRHLRIFGGELGQHEVHFVDYGTKIESCHTYKIVLRGTANNNGDSNNKKTPTKQFLAFEVTPKNATLEVDGEVWTLDATGSASRYLDLGVTYSYRVRATDYFTEEGTVTIDDPDNTKIVPVRLRSNSANVTFRVDADAEIWIDNQYKGTRTWTGRLGSRTYKVECRLANHETSTISQEITVAMEGQTIILPVPEPIYGSLVVQSTPNLCQLFIDGQDYGRTPKSINEILIGPHEIKLTKEGYADYTETVTLAKDETKQVNATLKEGSKEETFTVNGVSFTMKYVEGGTFWMGAQRTNSKGQNYDIEAWNEQAPVHSVTLSSYYMGETEVTQALWKAVMGYEPTINGGWVDKYGRGDNYPAYRVSWNETQEFILKLNKILGMDFRLPTEAEWEFAARGGKKSNGYKYAGSNTLGDVAVFRENSYDKDENSPDFGTHRVKSKKPNELGLYDMSGNVYEWCQDWFGNYSSSSQTNPIGPSTGSSRVQRGGNWASIARYCWISNRLYDDPDKRNDGLGFRLCLPQENSSQCNIKIERRTQKIINVFPD